MIQYDPPLRTVKRDDETIVLSCTECGHVWRALTFGRIEAYKSGERHQTITHGIEQNVAENPRRLWLARAATRRTPPPASGFSGTSLSWVSETG